MLNLFLGESRALGVLEVLRADSAAGAAPSGITILCSTLRSLFCCADFEGPDATAAGYPTLLACCGLGFPNVFIQ